MSMATLLNFGIRELSIVKTWVPSSMMVCNKCYYDKKEKEMKRKLKKAERRGKTFLATSDSLTAKGYLRPHMPYTPRSDVSSKVLELCKEFVGDGGNKIFSEPDLKFKLLNACYLEFQHSVPNSLLYRIQTIDDLVKFYATAVDVTLPLDAMKTVELPPNLHIQHEFVRFHPDTDTMFGGVSAFPQSSTIVTGLKYKKKYKGYSAKKSWP